jgi:hypothetical protein
VTFPRAWPILNKLGFNSGAQIAGWIASISAGETWSSAR